MDKLLSTERAVYQDGHFITADVLSVDSLIAKIGQNLEAEDARSSTWAACVLFPV